MYCPTIGGFDLSKKDSWHWVRERLRLYLDDLLFLAGGLCFICAAGDLFGRPAALAMAGLWLTVSSMMVARARGGGGQ